jgi:TolB-like protein/Flp pilus assembly protein TadD
MASLFKELQRRNVFRVAIAYIVLSWLLLQVGDTLAPALRLPESVNSVLAFFLILGFPLAIFFAWAYEMTPDGIRKEKDIDRTESIAPMTGRKLDRAIIVLLIAALGYFIWASRHPDNAIEEGPAEAVVPTASVSPSIAVLPFVNMSSDPEQEYFVDGLSEELLNLLAKIPELDVTSRSSAFFYKGKDIQIDDVGRELGVANILEGSVRRSGNRIRITAQLIEVDTDTHLWSETWDRNLDDVFAIQDEIAMAVVEQLKIQLLGATPHVVTTSPEAYALYLQGKQNSIAYSSTISSRDPVEAAPLAREALNKALELDASEAVALAMLGNLETTYEYDYEAAARYIERGLEENPGNTELVSEAANLAFVVGDYDKAVQMYREAAKKDPLNIPLLNFLGYAEYFAGNFDEALSAFRRSITLSPGAAGPNYYIATVHLTQGDHDRALAALLPENLAGFRFTGEALIYHALGDTEKSDAAVAALNELPLAWAYQRAIVYAYRGEADKAFEWLNTAIEIRDRGLNLILGDPFLDNVRDDPRFIEVLKRLNRAPE